MKKHCDNPDDCEYSDCPAAFCDKGTTAIGQMLVPAMIAAICAERNALLVEVETLKAEVEKLRAYKAGVSRVM